MLLQCLFACGSICVFPTKYRNGSHKLIQLHCVYCCQTKRIQLDRRSLYWLSVFSFHFFSGQEYAHISMNISISHYPFRIIIANLLKMEYTMRNSFHKQSRITFAFPCPTIGTNMFKQNI